MTVEWLGPNGSPISDDDRFNITGTRDASTELVLNSRLTFNNLMTSQAGPYMCRTWLTIPNIVTNHTVVKNFTVTVKCESACNRLNLMLFCIMHYYQNTHSVPSPEAVAVQRSRDGVLYEGTVFSLMCVITPNMTGVDTDIMVQRNISGPGSSVADRVTRMDYRQNSTLLFNPLALSDNGTYVCSSYMSSTSQYPYVIKSDVAMNDTTIDTASKLFCSPVYCFVH